MQKILEQIEKKESEILILKEKIKKKKKEITELNLKYEIEKERKAAIFNEKVVKEIEKHYGTIDENNFSDLQQYLNNVALVVGKDIL